MAVSEWMALQQLKVNVTNQHTLNLEGLNKHYMEQISMLVFQKQSIEISLKTMYEATMNKINDQVNLLETKMVKNLESDNCNEYNDYNQCNINYNEESIDTQYTETDDIPVKQEEINIILNTNSNIDEPVVPTVDR